MPDVSDRRLVVMLTGVSIMCAATAALFLAPSSAFAGAPYTSYRHLQPQVFAPGVISGPAEDDDPTFSPDGKTVYFTRSNTKDDYVMLSHYHDGAWSRPEIAAFSGRWRDMGPVMAPDGSYLIFVSNRPNPATHRRPDANSGGKIHPGRGFNLWRVDRTPSGWSKPRRLTDAINRDGTTFQPSVAANGDLYFSQVYGKGNRSHIYIAEFKNGAYEAPVPMPFTDSRWTDMGPAVAPDESFMVFDSTRPPAPTGHQELFIVFRTHGHWGAPQPLPSSINRMASSIVEESRLGPDGHTLYYTSGYIVPPPGYPLSTASSKAYLQQMSWNDGSDNIWKIDLAPWLKCHGRAGCRNGSG